MIQPQTLLNVADNSGAQELMCIRIIGTGNHRYAHIGDVIVAVIKEAVPNMPLERSEIIRAVIVRTCKELKRDNGMIIQYDDNAAVIIDQEGKRNSNFWCDCSGIATIEFYENSFISTRSLIDENMIYPIYSIYRNIDYI